MNFRNIEYEFTLNDLSAFYKYHFYQSPAVRKNWLRWRVFGFLAFAALPTLILVTSDKPPTETLAAIWPLLLGPAIFVLLMAATP